MSTERPYNPLNIEHFHTVDAAICKQTMAESVIDHSIDLGRFTIHHGTREGAPIIIAEHRNQQADELSAIWYDDTQQ